MAAPSRDFETADHEAMCGCSLPARGLYAFMRVEMKHSDRPGYLRLNGKPMSYPQLAHKAGCGTDEARRLSEELVAAGLLAYSDQDGFSSPTILRFESFRRECSRAGKKGGGNPALQDPATYKGSATFIGGSKGRSKGTGKDPPMVSSPPITPSSSFPPCEEGARAEREADGRLRGDARSFAVGWISAESPRHLAQRFIRPFADLVARVGKDRAVAEVRAAAAAGKDNPYAYALSLFDEAGNPRPAFKASAGPRHGTNGARPVTLTGTKVYDT